MTARELSKKWRAERLAWEDGAKIEGRAGGSEWAVYENPYWDSPQYEWRVKLEPHRLIHFALFPGAQAICGSQQWAKGGDGIGTEWSSTTCLACLAKKPGEPITAASEPTSREDLVRQRNWAVAESKRLKADLEGCQTNLEIVRQDRDRLCMCQAQATAPRPPLPDMDKVWMQINGPYSTEMHCIRELTHATTAIVKYLTP